MKTTALDKSGLVLVRAEKDGHWSDSSIPQWLGSANASRSFEFRFAKRRLRYATAYLRYVASSPAENVVEDCAKPAGGKLRKHSREDSEPMGTRTLCVRPNFASRNVGL